MWRNPKPFDKEHQELRRRQEAVSEGNSEGENTLSWTIWKQHHAIKTKKNSRDLLTNGELKREIGNRPRQSPE